MEQLKERDEEADRGNDGKTTDQVCFTGNSSRSETKRQTEETIGRQLTKSVLQGTVQGGR